jgi:hypothetical protein
VLTRLLVLATAAATLSGCAGSSAAPAASEIPSPVPASDQPTTVASAVASDTAQQTIALTVAAGKVTGQTGRVKVPLGTRLRITVTSDVADEVHVHVYDLKQDISPGSPTSIEFVADKPGQIEVELEKAKLTLTRLLVS